MKANETCVRCGKPCFCLATTQECATRGCRNYSPEFAAANEPKTKKLPIKEIAYLYGDGQGSPGKWSGLFGDWCSNAKKGDQLHVQCQKDPKYFIGPPKATDSYTVEELERMDMVGVYESKLKLKDFIKA